MSMGLRRLSIMPIMKTPEKMSKEASITSPFKNKMNEMGSQTSIVPTAGMMLNSAMTAPQIKAPLIPIRRSVRYPRNP